MKDRAQTETESVSPGKLADALDIVLADPASFFKKGYAEGIHRLDQSFRIIAEAQRKGILTKHHLNRIRRKRIQSIQELLVTTGECAQSVRMVAHRQDFVLLDAMACFVLDLLTWAKALQTEEFAAPFDNREKWFRGLADDPAVYADLRRVLFDSCIRERADALISFAQGIIHTATDYLDNRIEKRLSNLGYLKSHPGEISVTRFPKEIPDVDSILKRVSSCLISIPGVLGILLTGSRGGANFDQYSDVDLVSICDERPDRQARDGLLGCVGVKESFRSGAVESYELDGLLVVILFVRAGDQKKYLDTLESEGIKSFTLTFEDESSHKGWALPAYGWTSGKILKDTSGLLESFQKKASHYPNALQKKIWRDWTAVWETYSALFQDSAERGDLVTVFTSLLWCEEAALRLLFAAERQHCNPIEPKRFIRELAQVPGLPQKLITPLSMIRLRNPSRSLERQYEDISAVWSHATRRLEETGNGDI